MRWAEQGAQQGGRYTVVPRTLSFVLYEQQVLLLRGAPHKRLWAGRLNGVGGHVEPGEDVLSGARREIREETGLVAQDLTLRALIHISGRDEAPGVMLFVFVGRATTREMQPSGEGELGWYPLEDLPVAELVDDLALLLPRLLTGGRGSALLYGRYLTDESGQMSFHFGDGNPPVSNP